MAVPARVIMVAGTGSHAGKSVLAAALCRMYARRGFRVAPFKAQNMALNSFVTAEGGELGRAQAYQADAAGVEPHVDMNPILLKPSSQTGCQVIVLGRPVRHMSVREYHAYQQEVWPVATAALDRLRSANDLIVIEGAGSIAEINLRDHDIVNMKVALYARAPVLLVADIDRGGVFASLYGTVELLEPDERALIRAFVINKFRGDASLLESGIRFLDERTGIPTLGVIPYLSDWRGDEEDSLGIEDRQRRTKPDAGIRIAVVRLPFVSNYTDFDALSDEQDVSVTFVTSPRELTGMSAIILPGTKSTIDDLRWLRESGLADAIVTKAAEGVPVLGICGGYQMLGKVILDPDRVESAVTSTQGLGLLDVETVFVGDRRTVRVIGELTGAGIGPEGTPVSGYEIHMGRSRRGPGARPLLRLWEAGGEKGDGQGGSGDPGRDSHEDGAVSLDGVVFGSYVHGLFDHPAVRERFLDALRRTAGLSVKTGPENRPSGESAQAGAASIDRLADHVAAYLDPSLLETIVGIGS